MNQLLVFLCILPSLSLAVIADEGCDCEKVDGGLTEWTQFTPCSKSCGPGDKTRFRFCAAPYARHGGQDCIGNLTEQRYCNLGPCPRDGGWSAWKTGQCSKSCGGGIEIETRTCDNPTPYCGKDCVGEDKRIRFGCNNHTCPEWKFECGDCDWQTDGSCAKFCQQVCWYQGEKVDDSYCSGEPKKEEYRSCDTNQCPERFEWKYKCENETDKICRIVDKEGCIQECTQTCFNNANVKVDNSNCQGYPKTKNIECQHPNKKEFCPDDPVLGFCKDCKKRALDDAEKLTDPYQKANFVGHACRDWEVEADLRKYCQDNEGNLSKKGGLPANDWFWVHCSPDGPWCKPCSTRGLVFNKKCDACESTRNGTCTGNQSG